MGYIYQPYCHSCNYIFKDIIVGVGMRGPEYHYAPAACYHFHRLSEKNLNLDTLTCSRCKREITPLKGFGMDEEPKEHEKNRCPKCEEKTLELMDAGDWD